MSNCSGCGRGVAAALLPGPQLPCLWILMKLCSIHTNWHGQFCSGKNKGGIEAGKWGERVRQDGDGDEQDKSSEPEPSRRKLLSPPLSKKITTLLYAHGSPDSTSTSENGCKDAERHRARIYGKSTDNCRLLGFSLLPFYPTRCGCYKRRTQRGQSSSTITNAFPSETLTSLCSTLFIWAKARDPVRGADNYWYLLPAIRMGAKHRATLQYHYVN